MCQRCKALFLSVPAGYSLQTTSRLCSLGPFPADQARCVLCRTRAVVPHAQSLTFPPCTLPFHLCLQMVSIPETKRIAVTHRCVLHRFTLPFAFNRHSADGIHPGDEAHCFILPYNRSPRFACTRHSADGIHPEDEAWQQVLDGLTPLLQRLLAAPSSQ